MKSAEFEEGDGMEAVHNIEEYTIEDIYALPEGQRAELTIYLEPDLSVVCDKSKFDDRGCIGAPDWVIEIVSPTSRTRDYGIKTFQYRAAGVKEYWIVDSDKDRITVWNFEQDTMEEYSFRNAVRAGIYEDFEIDFSRLNIQ